MITRGLNTSTLLLALLCVGVGCSTFEEEGARTPGLRFAERGVSLEIPSGWSVSGFSQTVFPRRLVAASYPVTRSDVEGDCGGLPAVERLARGGAYVVLIDYGGNFEPDVQSRSDFKQHLPVTLKDGRLAEFECFGRSYAFRFIAGGRRLQAHLGLGPTAGQRMRARALAALNSIRVERPS